MEHVDALEAVRRLTLERDALLSVVVERDALAEQVRRLEEGLKWETDCKDRAWQAAFRFDAENYLLAEQVKLLKEQNAPQAPERHEHHETDAETGEGGNGAPRGCEWACRTCETCKHSGYAPLLGRVLCQRDSPLPSFEPEGAAIWPIVAKTDCCGEWGSRETA